MHKMAARGLIMGTGLFKRNETKTEIPVLPALLLICWLCVLHFSLINRFSLMG